MPPAQQFFYMIYSILMILSYIITLVNCRSPQLYLPVLLIDESTKFAYLDYIPSHITNVPLICMRCSALVQLRCTVHYRPHLLFQTSIIKLSVHRNPQFPL
jgi:hypothetical protein